MSTITADQQSTPPGPPPDDALGACLAAMTSALRGVTNLPAWAMSDADLQARLADALRVRAGLDELISRLVGSIDERDLATQAGASSSRAWLMATHRVSDGAAGQLLAQARSMTGSTEPTRRAWATGQISGEQAVAIGASIGAVSSPDVDSARLRAAQADLVRHAAVLGFAQFQTLCRHLVEVVDPEAADARLGQQLQDQERRALQETTMRISRIGDGTSRIAGRVPDLAADMLKAALEACSSPRRQHARRPADAAATSAADGCPGSQMPPTDGCPGSQMPPAEGVGAPCAGRGPSSVMDVDGDHCDAETGVLTHSQRLGHAFVELIEHLPADKLPHHGASNATVVVNIGLDQLRTGLGEATLDTGTAISAAEARRLACNGDLIPAVFDGDPGPLDLGRSQRLYSRQQRIALAIRDGGCVWPGCERPPAWTEAHHLVPWSQGGLTDLTNGCLVCGFHHRLVHKGDWRIELAPDNVPELVPPPRIDPQRRPIRHQRFRPRAGDTGR